MQSLADYLGTGATKADGSVQRPSAPSLLDAQCVTAKEFSDAVLNSIEFRQYIAHALTLGDLPAAVITRFMDYSWGKPADKIEFEDKTAHFEAMSRQDLVVRIQLLQSLLEELPDDSTSVH